VLGEDALSKLSQLFPERQIKTDQDATRLIKELGDNARRVAEQIKKEYKC
jgi:hypothetical protein